METRSLLDYLTDLPNRVTFLNVLSDKIERTRTSNERFYVMLLDLDGLKKTNDTYGHDAGDKLIKDFSGIVLSHIERPIDFLARYGGDEFMIITERKDYLAWAEKIRKAIRAHTFEFYDERKKKKYMYRLSVSIGIVTFPIDATAIKDLLTKVDKALYLSKFHGRNRITLYRFILWSRIAKFLKVLLLILVFMFASWLVLFRLFPGPVKEIAQRVTSANYDSVVLNDGRQVLGKILMISDAEITIKPSKPSDAPLLTIDRDKVQAISFSKK